MSQEIGPFEDLRETVVAACEAAIARGLALSAKDGWGVLLELPAWKPKPNCRVCPMGAVLIGSEAGPLAYQQVDAAGLLGVDEVWVRAFTDGFDDGFYRPAIAILTAGEDPIDGNARLAAYELGVEMRQRYAPGA